MLQQGYVRVVKEEGCESIELPLEIDSSLLLSTLQSAFPKACGLKYRTDDNVLRGVRLSSNRCYPPEGSWIDTIFICIMSKEEKRKAEDSGGNQTKKRAVVSDLIILGLAWRTTEDQVRRYFENFGEVTMTVVKTDQVTRLSKGFGFVRFRDPVVQTSHISETFYRWKMVRRQNTQQPPSGRVAGLQDFRWSVDFRHERRGA
uniref:TAR DNA-binding protein 43 n=1 Tax=Lygus hesperus TaxID=30085 RepID=A0A0A9WK86_LYGHE